MKLTSRSRIVGCYLVACSIFQIFVYVQPRGMSSILDPRLGFGLIPAAEVYVTGIQWGSAFWFLALGISILIWKLKGLAVVYVLSECLLAIPTIVYLGVSLLGGAGHLTLGFADIFIQFGIIVIFSAVPLALAINLVISPGMGS